MPFDRRSEFSSAPKTGSLSLTLTCSTGRVASPGPESCEAGGAEPPTQLGKRQIQCLDLGLGLWGLGLRVGSFVDAKKSLHPPENTNNSRGTFKTMSICRNKLPNPHGSLEIAWNPSRPRASAITSPAPCASRNTAAGMRGIASRPAEVKAPGGP